MGPRVASIKRTTLETDINLELDLDGEGRSELNTGVPFLEHMLEQVVRHGGLNLKLQARGDLIIDAHHTVEDIGISIGQGLRAALGDRAGVRRYGHAYVPLDEALARAVIDLSGRPHLSFRVQFPNSRVGEFDLELCYEFFQGLVNHAALTLHLDLLQGRNAHHIAEAVFKAFGRALRMAIEIDPRASTAIPSTKGVL